MQNQMEQQAIELIKKLSADPKNQDPLSTWYCIAAVSFAGCNQGPLVVRVYEAAISLYGSNSDARRLILRRIKESLLKAAPLISVPRLLNAFFPLIKAIPDEESIDREVARAKIDEIDLNERGMSYMKELIGKSDAESLVASLNKFWPDLLHLVVNQSYGTYVAELSILDKIATSQVLIAGLLPMDCPVEVSWHWRGLINVGGTLEQVDYATDIAKSVCHVTGVQLKKDLFAIEDVIHDHGLLSKHL